MPFDAAIITRDFTGIFDNALVLGGASYLRTINYGGGWSRLRIGALVAATPFGTNSIQDTAFAIGLCAGKDYPGSSNLPGNAFGASINGSFLTGSPRTLSYTANSGFPYFVCTSGTVYRRIGNTQQTSASLGAFFIPVAYTGTQKRRFPIVVDITRPLGGAGLATVTVYGITIAASAQIDYRPDDLQAALDAVGTPTIRGVAYTASTTISTITIGDEAGPLDTFELFWSNSAYPLEVYAVGAVIINSAQNTLTGTAYTGGFGGALDNVQQYTPDVSVTAGFSSFGSGFSGAGTVYGYWYGTTVMGLTGTSGGVPYDTFEQYSVGTVISGVTLNAGTGWSGNGFIY